MTPYLDECTPAFLVGTNGSGVLVGVGGTNGVGLRATVAVGVIVTTGVGAEGGVGIGIEVEVGTVTVGTLVGVIAGT